MLTVNVPAACNRLTTLTAAKVEMGLSGTSDDAWLGDTIDRASAAIRQHCNRVFARETVRETFRLDRYQPELVLSRFPVAAIASVTEDGAALDSADYEPDTGKGVVYRLGSSNRYRCWPAAVVTVEYSAGFVLPGSTGRTLPADIERAAIAVIKAWWHARLRDPAIRSGSVEGIGAETYLDDLLTASLPPEAEGLLESYRVPAVG